MTSLYRMHDQDPGGHGGCQPISVTQASPANAQGFGIFWTVNDFHGPRQIRNLARINAWAVDLDSGSKESQLQRIKEAPLRPTMIVESKRGYHVYYRAKDPNPSHWNAIVLDRLVPFFGADKNARDIARILRAPGYYHMKDPSDPFMIRKVYEFPVAYTEQQMALRFPEHSAITEQKKIHKAMRPAGAGIGDPMWQRIWDLDCEEALNRISGEPIVSGEVYSFRRTSRGNLNIYVNGRGTSCWVDTSGRIGSLDKGGPTIAQWLRWYGHDWRSVLDAVKKYFPEVV